MHPVVRYRRVTHDDEGNYIGGDGWNEAHAASGGIVHMLWGRDRWMTIEEVCAEAASYNSHFGEQAFATDPVEVQRALNILVAAGMVEAT